MNSPAAADADDDDVSAIVARRFGAAVDEPGPSVSDRCHALRLFEDDVDVAFVREAVRPAGSDSETLRSVSERRSVHGQDLCLGSRRALLRHFFEILQTPT